MVPARPGIAESTRREFQSLKCFRLTCCVIDRPVTPDGKFFDTGEHRENDLFAERAWMLPFQSF
jgi:hypothetical protein